MRRFSERCERTGDGLGDPSDEEEETGPDPDVHGRRHGIDENTSDFTTDDHQRHDGLEKGKECRNDRWKLRWPERWRRWKNRLRNHRLSKNERGRTDHVRDISLLFGLHTFFIIKFSGLRHFAQSNNRFLFLFSTRRHEAKIQSISFLLISFQ